MRREALIERIQQQVEEETAPIPLAPDIEPLELATPGEATDLGRILDASSNRAPGRSTRGRGLRPVRARRPNAHPALKDCRHRLSEALRGLEAEGRLIASRDTPGDVGTHIMTAAEQSRENPRAVLAANFKRTGEALRSLEEYSKLVDVWLAGRFEVLRYDVYTLEKLVMTAVASRHSLYNARLYVLVGGLPTLGDLTWIVGEARRGRSGDPASGEGPARSRDPQSGTRGAPHDDPGKGTVHPERPARPRASRAPTASTWARTTCCLAMPAGWWAHRPCWVFPLTAESRWNCACSTGPDILASGRFSLRNQGFLGPGGSRIRASGSRDDHVALVRNRRNRGGEPGRRDRGGSTSRGRERDSGKGGTAKNGSAGRLETAGRSLGRVRVFFASFSATYKMSSLMGQAIANAQEFPDQNQDQKALASIFLQGIEPENRWIELSSRSKSVDELAPSLASRSDLKA